MTQAHDRLVDRRDVGALADEDQVGIVEGEDLPIHLLDQELEGVDGDADMVAAPVIGAQLRQMDVDGPPPAGEFGQALNEFVELVLLARLLLAVRTMQHRWGPLARKGEMCSSSCGGSLTEWLTIRCHPPLARGPRGCSTAAACDAFCLRDPRLPAAPTRIDWGVFLAVSQLSAPASAPCSTSFPAPTAPRRWPSSCRSSASRAAARSRSAPSSG